MNSEPAENGTGSPAVQKTANFPVIENIEFIDLIGRGGGAEVYKARQTILDRLLAVKVLNLKASADDTALKRFQNEAKLSASLEHENIARTFGSGISASGQPYLLMEFVEGKSLADLIKAEAPLPFSRIRSLFIPLLRALSYAHSLGLVHRDIKPENIIVGQDHAGKETVKLLDFGIACLFEPDCEQVAAENAGKGGLTATGVAIGSPAYMSPEQCLGKKADERSDLYSLACVMYEASLKEPPYKGNSFFELMQEHVYQKLPSTRELARTKGIPEKYSRLILSALSKDPDKRPATAKEFESRLLAVLDEITADRVPGLRLSQTKSKLLQIGAIASVAFVLLTFAFVNFGLLPGQKKETAAGLEKYQSESITSLSIKAEEFDVHGKYREGLQLWEQVLKKMRSQSTVSSIDLIKVLSHASTDATGTFKNSDPAVGDRERKVSAQKALDYARQCRDLAAQKKYWDEFNSSVSTAVDIYLRTKNESAARDILRESLREHAADEPKVFQMGLIISCAELFYSLGSDQRFALSLIAPVAVESRKEEFRDLSFGLLAKALAIQSNIESKLAENEKSLEHAKQAGEELNKNQAIATPERRYIVLSLADNLKVHNPDLLEKIISYELTENRHHYSKSLDSHTALLYESASLYESSGRKEKALGRLFEIRDLLKSDASSADPEFLAFTYKEKLKTVLTKIWSFARQIKEQSCASKAEQELNELDKK